MADEVKEKPEPAVAEEEEEETEEPEQSASPASSAAPTLASASSSAAASPSPATAAPAPATTPSSWARWAMGGMTSAANWCKTAVQAGWQTLTVERGATPASGEKTEWDSKERESLWAKLQKLVGKDIVSMISLPVWVFEPVSFLQMMAVPLEFTELFDHAASEPDRVLRTAHVAAIVCGFYCDELRPKKPFNPILGETFELVSKNGKFRFFCEQVSHHPPISVGKVVATDGAWEAILETHLKSKFYGNSSDFFIEGTNHIDFPKTGDHITWGHMTTVTHNIILGGIWIDHYGEITAKNHATGDTTTIRFAKAGFMAAGQFGVTGEVRDAQGKVRYRIAGKWNERISAVRCNPETGEPAPVAQPKVLWEHPARTYDPRWHFHTYMSEELVALPPEYEAILPSTDSRLRTDRRLLEKGDQAGAGAEKHRLEEKQRAEERERKARKEEWVPRYFKKVPHDKYGYVWVMDDKYWAERVAREQAAKAKATAASSAAEAPSPSAQQSALVDTTAPAAAAPSAAEQPQ